MLPGLTTFSIPEEKVLWLSTGVLEKPSIIPVLLLEVLVKISLPSINLSWGECSFSCMTNTVMSFPPVFQIRSEETLKLNKDEEVPGSP